MARGGCHTKRLRGLDRAFENATPRPTQLSGIHLVSCQKYLMLAAQLNRPHHSSTALILSRSLRQD